jgi:hypothetical protein
VRWPNDKLHLRPQVPYVPLEVVNQSPWWTDSWATEESHMATAMAMQPPSILPLSIPLATSQSVSQRRIGGPDPAVSPTYTRAEAFEKEGSRGQCDGCRRRNSRCAMNLAANKCYSCDFHRQDCVFTPNTSRKRSYPQPCDIAEKKRYVQIFSLVMHKT